VFEDTLSARSVLPTGILRPHSVGAAVATRLRRDERRAPSSESHHVV
jgi:hypothetical protein